MQRAVYFVQIHKYVTVRILYDEVLASLDIDVEQYRVNPNIKEKELMPDFFC